ncbi:hypothetical protein A7U60_g4039 [Sanghuangporus baumii]|uniref:Uncharacterized protein n=1 Tax=Sanghuangporus baumii TaxID=108892 RepID=A0A9Q5HZM1_SANBA|nr:hypothetical protein A7U60_g4039 [Sanghuangporus baumii]
MNDDDVDSSSGRHSKVNEATVPLLSATGRPVRPRMLPKRYRQLSPPKNVQQREPDPEEDILVWDDSDACQCADSESNQEPRFDVFRTDRDKFGLQKVFRRERPPSSSDSDTVSPEAEHRNPYHPIPNYSAYRMFKWFLSNSATKSFADFKRLQLILSDPKFHAEDFVDVDLAMVNRRLADSSLDDDGWIKVPVTISVPLGHLSDDAPKSVDFYVEGFMYQPLIAVIQSVLRKDDATNFCYEPYQM